MERDSKDRRQAVQIHAASSTSDLVAFMFPHIPGHSRASTRKPAPWQNHRHARTPTGRDYFKRQTFVIPRIALLGRVGRGFRICDGIPSITQPSTEIGGKSALGNLTARLERMPKYSKHSALLSASRFGTSRLPVMWPIWSDRAIEAMRLLNIKRPAGRSGSKSQLYFGYAKHSRRTAPSNLITTTDAVADIRRQKRITIGEIPIRNKAMNIAILRGNERWQI